MLTPEDKAAWEFAYYMEMYVEPFFGVVYHTIGPAIIILLNIIMSTVAHLLGAGITQ